MTLLHDTSCTEYSSVGHPERPSRVKHAEAHLRQVFPGCPWVKPSPATTDDVLRAHTRAHLERLREPNDFDGDTPYHEGIADHALMAAGAAIETAHLALAGAKPFSLMRPPGHHACRSKAMGFCYLSSVAMAALSARAAGAARVAIWDFDAHHGNGTEDIVAGAEGVRFVSVHQFPGYPGTGLRSTTQVRNYPVGPGTSSAEHMEILESSWEEVLAFKPELVLVSAGFDAYKGDPITEMSLEAADFAELGRWCATSPAPVGAVLEGGYSDDLPILIEGFLKAWWRA